MPQGSSLRFARKSTGGDTVPRITPTARLPNAQRDGWRPREVWAASKQLASSLQKSGPSPPPFFAMTLKSPENKILPALLRGELAAVESYRQVIRCFPELAAHPLLEGVRADHTRAVHTLRSLIVSHGDDLPPEGEPWNFLFGADDPKRIFTPQCSALAAFKQGEKHTVSQYILALEDDALAAPAKVVIRDELLPLAWKNWLHMATLMT